MTDRIAGITIIVVCLLLYVNTLGHSFTQDDAIVIYQNEFTKKGLAGIRDIFSKDSFYGFFGSDRSSLVSGGRYRPLSIAFFAVVYEIAGDKTLIYHLVVVCIYALLCWSLFHFINRLSIPRDVHTRRLLAWTAVMLFAAHPLHTEAVANVKGLDEIFSLLFGVVVGMTGLAYMRRHSVISLIGSAFLLFLALLSKENAIIYVLLLPLVMFYFVENRSNRSLLTLSSTWLVVSVLYVLLRASIIGSGLGAAPMEMLNNPFIKYQDGVYAPFTFAEKWSTIVYGLGKNLQLLIFPHPLTHDYYPRHFPVSKWIDVPVIMSFIMNACLVLIALLGIRRRSFVSFAILFYFISTGLTSNILFPIGTHLSERFLFVAVLPFTLLLSYFLVRNLDHKKVVNVVPIALTALFILYSFKTVTRNKAWKDDFTLFTTDVNTSPNSAKVQNAAGGALIERALTLADESLKLEYLHRAKRHLAQALEVHPHYKNANLLKANAHMYLKEYTEAIKAYKITLRLDPNDRDTRNNIVIALREGARQVGSQDGNTSQAIQWLSEALSYKPDDEESISLMGIALGNEGRHAEALTYFEKVILLRPDNARNYLNKGYALLGMGREDEAQISFNQAARIDPSIFNDER